MHRIALPLLLIGSAALLATMNGPASMAPAVHADSERAAETRASEWKQALVFRRDGGRSYVGTVEKPEVGSLEPAASSASKSEVPTAADYEVWLARDGATRALWYSSTSGTYGTLSMSGEAGPAALDQGTLAAVVKAARAPSTSALPRIVGGAIGCYATTRPRTLADLSGQSDLIVVGQIAGVLRNAHTPVNARGLYQHTVFAFAVERYLKTNGAGAPALLKVRQIGGWLPWDEGGVRGVGFVFQDEPLLILGQRYCLFLDLPKPSPEVLRRGFCAGSYGGIWGKSAELDECSLANPWRARLLLREGFTRAQPDVPEVDQHWRFDTGPQILDVREQAAFQAIREAVTQEGLGG